MIRYKILIFLLACTALVSCIDDLESCVDENDDIPKIFTDGYSLNMKVTLDPMGGMRISDGGRAAELQELENYIDPEKFRVLFFDREDRFLFESKSRWVKKLVPNGKESDFSRDDFSQWLLSVPLYAYGNDESEDWNWEEIRRVITGEDINDKDSNGKDIYTDKSTTDADGNLLPAFKIAILANRPLTEWNMGINGRDGTGNDYKDDKGNPTDVITPFGYSIHNGPNWKTTDTRWGSSDARVLQDDDKIVRVYDLHHCQYDPIYDGKNWEGNGHVQGENGYDYSRAEKIGDHYYINYGYYNFITGQIADEKGIMRPTLGATSTWVDWGDNDDNKLDIGGKEVRKFAKLSQEHPIPMYGIQAFAPITGWVKGEPFNLSEIAEDQDDDYAFKSISLLRSVVKLELVLPPSQQPADFVLLYYPNIYARCEPMDVWTPTDQIWKKDVHYGWTGTDKNKWDPETECEWQAIRNYGPISQNKIPDDNNKEKKSAEEYPKRMAWFYGAWYERGFWTFNNNKDVTNILDGYIEEYKTKYPGVSPFPHIFNSCVQRNTYVYCDDFYTDLSGNYHYVVYTGERNLNDPSDLPFLDNQDSGKGPTCYWMVQRNGYRYGIAIADNNEYGPSPFIDYGSNKNILSGCYYEQCAPGASLSNRLKAYENAVQAGNAKNMPWPLLRNHVYRITIGVSNAKTRSGGEDGLSIKSEVFYSESINFDKPKKEKKDIEQPKKGTEKELSISRK